MKYVKMSKIRFKHCDYAGIVFYPRYFEMVNDLVEDWFGELDFSFAKIHDKENDIGLPVVHIDCAFTSPGYIGDTLKMELEVVKLGNTSCVLAINFMSVSSGKKLLELKLTVVCIELTSKTPTPWKEVLKNKIRSYVCENTVHAT